MKLWGGHMGLLNFSMVPKPPVGQDLLYIEALSVTLRRTTLGRTPLDG